jgi:translation initiation factor IF-2
VERALAGKLAPKFEEVGVGRAEVRTTFKVPNVGVVAGCYVQDGVVRRGLPVRVVRSGTVVYESVVSSLKRFKEDVREVAAGYECGVGVERFNDLKEGDLLEVYEQRQVARA